MNDTSPPGYSSTSIPDDTASKLPSVLVNLSPRVDSTSFQLGYLGHGQAFIAGDVQVKFAGSETQGRPSCAKLVIAFRGVERVDGAGEIELCEQREVLWGEGAAGTSSGTSPSTSTSFNFPPSNNPFKLAITPDLPVCLHLGTSSLEYTLVAELYFSDPSLAPIVRCAPVHLSRTSPPDSSLSDQPTDSNLPRPSTLPSMVSGSDPIAFSVKLPRTVFRKGEPIELVARIEVPTAKVVGEGLRLRTVSAELVRVIDIRSISSSSAAEDERQRSHETVLAHSGKSARFSPSRPIVIRLVLHPPSDLVCDTISQSTILHSVSFAVVVTVGLFKLNIAGATSSTTTTSMGPTSFDATLSQRISIVPPFPSSRTDKQREAEQESRLPDPSVEGGGRWPLFSQPALPLADSPGEGADGPVPSYVEHGADDPGIPTVASTSNASRWNLAAEDEEEEYDGYEELSIPADEAGPPPPGIDEDVSPPSPSDVNHRRALPRSASQSPQPEEEEEDSPPDDFASMSISDLRAASLTPASEPSSPPPPLSPLSTTQDHYQLPPLAPRAHVDTFRASPAFPLEPNCASSTAVSTNPEDEYLPPPYIGTQPRSHPPPIHHRNLPSRHSRALSSSSPTRHATPPPLPLPLPPHSHFSSSLPPPPPPPIDTSLSSTSNVLPERRTSENSISLLRDPPPYREEEAGGGRGGPGGGELDDSHNGNRGRREPSHGEEGSEMSPGEVEEGTGEEY